MFSHVVIFWTDPANPPRRRRVVGRHGNVLAEDSRCFALSRRQNGVQPSARGRSKLPGGPQYRLPRQEDARRLPGAPFARGVRQPRLQEDVPKGGYL